MQKILNTIPICCRFWVDLNPVVGKFDENYGRVDMLLLQAAAVAAGVPVGQYIQENPPRMQDAVVYPDGSAADAYGAAFQRHVSSGEMLFGSG